MEEGNGMHLLANHWFDPRINPGETLYAHWRSVLEAQFGPPEMVSPGSNMVSPRAMFFGPIRDWGIGWRGPLDTHANDPVIVAGEYYNGGVVNGRFALNSSGHFRIASMFGWKQRDKLAEATFLRCQHFHSQYNWMYGSEFVGLGRTWGQPPPNAAHYVSEKVMDLSGYLNFDKPAHDWMKLERVGVEWTIQPAPVNASSKFAEFDTLRAKRYERAERARKIASGEITPRARTARLTEDEIEERMEAQAAALTSHLTLSPAVTTSKKEVK